MILERVIYNGEEFFENKKKNNVFLQIGERLLVGKRIRCRAVYWYCDDRDLFVAV